MGSIYAEKALYGSGAAMTTPAKSGRASGSASRRIRTGSCDFIFGTVCSSAVQDRLGNKRPYHGRSPSLLKGGQGSNSLERRSGFEAPSIPLAIPSHWMNCSTADERTGRLAVVRRTHWSRACANWLLLRWRHHGPDRGLDLANPTVGENSATRTALLDNWTWGLSLIALTIAIHATGVTFMVSILHSFRVRLEHRSFGLPHLITIVIAAFTAMGLLLVVLHGVESTFWAVAYLWLGALDSPRAAILYSVDTMATRGASGLMLHPHWQMMGALEAADGMLLFGISTAFIFTVMQFYYQHLVLQPPAAPSKQISPDRRPADARSSNRAARDLARAPGRRTAALRVDRWLDGVDLCRKGLLWLGRSDHEPAKSGRASGSA